MSLTVLFCLVSLTQIRQDTHRTVTESRGVGVVAKSLMLVPQVIGHLRENYDQEAEQRKWVGTKRVEK